MVNRQPVFRAIADPTRREIINMLALKDMSVGEVAGSFDMTRPAIAKHLNILKKADLISAHKEGRRTVNRLKPDSLKTVADWLSYFDRFWDKKLIKLKQAVEDKND